VLGADFAELLERSRSGDEAAFSLIWRDVNPPLVRYLRVLTPRGAEDAASETWLDVVRHWRSFEGDEAALRAWIFTIARRKVVDAWRKDKRRPIEIVDDETLLETYAPYSPSAEAAATDRITTEGALELISRLPREQAEVVLLRVVAGLDTHEVCKIVGATAGAVRVRQHRALRALEKLLAASREQELAATIGAEPVTR
jgi:RNA polymerase sigma-70 factor (ECF subfamily)